MILRRSRPADPRLVLGSALAMLLPLGANFVALAQTPTPQPPSAQVPLRSTIPASGTAPTEDALKQHDQELDTVRAQQRQSADSQAKLRLQIEALS